MKVVVAHACDESRARYAEVLAGAGHDVCVAADREEALTRCRDQPPDVVLLDESLSGEDGVLEALKGDVEAYRAAVVLIERSDLDLAAAVSALEAMIFEDPLTGLFNRRFILTQLGALVSGARRHERPLAIAMIDVDHFKAFNDRYGHAAGDAVPAEVAGVRQRRLGRLGGDTAEELLRRADQALAEAKGRGRDRAVGAGPATLQRRT